jgi:acetyltransferase-like isoleucine patch superfamily enzyme
MMGLLLRIIGKFRRTHNCVKIALYRRLGATIGSNVRLYGKLDGVNPQLISIGDNTVVGENSVILGHCPRKGACRTSVGNNCFIGYGAIILPGVHIADDSLIGAGSVVTGSFPKGAVIAGNPARQIGVRSPAEVARMVDAIKKGLSLGKDGSS